MRRARIKRIAAALAILSTTLVLTGCGKGDPDSVYPPGYTGGYTPYGGILPPGCNGGVPLVPGQSIGYGFNGATISGVAIKAGLLPPIPERNRFGYEQHGGVGIQGLGAIPPSGPQGGYPYTGGSVFGTVGMNFSSSWGQAAGNGYVQISSAAAKDIIASVYTNRIPLNGSGFYGSGYNPWNVPQVALPQYNNICITGIGFDLTKQDPSYYGAAGRLYMGEVYLFLNGSQNGYALEF